MNGGTNLGGTYLTGETDFIEEFNRLLAQSTVNPDNPLAKALINLQYYDDNLPSLTVPALNVTSTTTPNTGSINMNGHQLYSLQQATANGQAVEFSQLQSVNNRTLAEQEVVHPSQDILTVITGLASDTHASRDLSYDITMSNGQAISSGKIYYQSSQITPDPDPLEDNTMLITKGYVT